MIVWVAFALALCDCGSIFVDSCALHCTSFLSLALYRQKFVTSISDFFHQSEFFQPLNVSLLFKCHQCVLDTRFGSQLAFLSTARQERTVMLFNSMLRHSFRPCQQNCQQTVFEFETLSNAFTLISEFSLLSQLLYLFSLVVSTPVHLSICTRKKN